jgi:hypothetical protein
MVSWAASRGKIGEMNENGCRDCLFPYVLRVTQFELQGDKGMLYAILAYHAETDVMSWTKEADAGLMDRLTNAHQKVNEGGRLGPAARLDFTGKARTLRGPGQGVVVDGPFAETKEQLLGFYVLECADDDAAVEAARTLRHANPSAVYEIRPVMTYVPGISLPAS